MRRFIAGLVIVAACSPGEQPESLSYPPNGVLPFGKLRPSHAPGDSFEVRLWSPYLEGMKEPRLDPMRHEANVYRFTLIPSFTPSVALRIEPHGDGCAIVRKQAHTTSDIPDSIPREGVPMPPMRHELTFADSIRLPDAECRSLINAFSALEIREDTVINVGPDGESWMFERLEGHHYSAIIVWSPDARGRDSVFVRVGSAMLRAAGYENGAFRRR